MLKGYFEGYFFYKTYTGKYHIMMELDADLKEHWPYYDFISLCGSYMTSSRWRNDTPPNIKWTRNKYKCKRCDKFFKQSKLGD